jgi:hypothetical protein
MLKTVFLALSLVLLADYANAEEPTAVINDSDPVKNPYQAWQQSGTCSVGVCSIAFPAVTKKTLILHTFCNFGLPAGGGLEVAAISAQNVNLPNFMEPLVNFANSSLTIYTINSETYLFLSVGQVPQVAIASEGTAVTNLSCTIAGYTLY